MSSHQINENIFSQGLLQKQVLVPEILLRYSQELDLTDTQMVLLIHLLSFQQRSIPFPSMEELSLRMGHITQIIEALESLLSRGLLQINEGIDEDTGMICESYDLLPLFAKLASLALTETPLEKKEQDQMEEENVFSVFEREFGRVLSPNECETIANWIDEDSYSQELIFLALKEAVFSGKLHFHYIDRILLEWSRKGIKTEAEAKQYSLKFRGE